MPITVAEAAFEAGNNCSYPTGPTSSFNRAYLRCSWTVMDIDLLRTFVAICDTKSFTAAARQVGRTQSAVSLQMKRLEGSLGRPLFQRGVPGAVLTEHGAMLVPNARRILAAVGETLASFDRATMEGIFVIGMPDDYAPRVLVPTLQALGALFPLASVDIVIDESRALVKRLAEGSVDLAFVTEEEGPMSGGRRPLWMRLSGSLPAPGTFISGTRYPSRFGMMIRTPTPSICAQGWKNWRVLTGLLLLRAA